LPSRAVKELRPVSEAKDVDKTDVTALRKNIVEWEAKQKKEAEAQQRRQEQGERKSGGRRWGDIMERGERRRPDRTGDRNSDELRRRAWDQRERAGGAPPEKARHEKEDVEPTINEKPDQDNGSDKDDDLSFDDVPKSTKATEGISED